MKGQKGTQLLDTLLHEALHAAFWDLDESVVRETATDLAKFLEANGVGFVEEKPSREG